MKEMLQFLQLHVQSAHPTQAGATVQVSTAKPTTKVDKRPRPEISCEMSEHDWRIFLSEWEDYKRATGVTDQHMLDELWSCMTPDIRRLAFDQGGKASLDTEIKMMQMIKGLAVSVLHEAVHTVELHGSRQLSTESTKAFAARVRGVATNCNLTKKCECKKEVTFIEETVYNVVLAGLYDRDMQERAISAAILKTIKDINSLVEFCSAEESGRKSAPGVGAIRSTFQSNKMRGGGDGHTKTKCGFCGGPSHSSNSRETRAKECKAFNHSCRSCGKPGHYASVCKGGKPVKPEEKPGNKNAAVEVQKEEEIAKVEAFAFCSIIAVPTSNSFQPLAGLQDGDTPLRREGPGRDIYNHGSRRAGGRVQPYPPRQYQRSRCTQNTTLNKTAPVSAYSYPELPLPGHTIYPPTQDREEEGLVGHLSSSVRIPLCHMEYMEGPDGSWAFREIGPLPSPQLKVKMQLDTDAYTAHNLPPPQLLHPGKPRPVTSLGVADTGAQMDICDLATAKSVGVDIASLLPVKARVFGATREAELKIVGAMFVKISHPSLPSRTTIRMFYVASNVSRTYLSLGTMKALGVVEQNFPNIPTLYEVAAPIIRNTVPVWTLPPSNKMTLPCSPTEENLTAHREQCKGGTMRAPSHPAPPPSEPTQPDFPFSHVVADFFTIDAGTYLAMADRYSNWLSIFKLKKDDSYQIIEVLRQYFSRWGVAVNITTAGASVFTSTAVRDFLERWGVEHRVSSAYYPRANNRSEIAVKSAKRLIMDNLGPNGSLNTDQLARALLAHRNCPDPETGLSAAQIIFGRELRDHLPAVVSRYQPRQEWRLEEDLRARARSLPPLAIGDTVAVQDQSLSTGKPGRWNKSPIVVEVLPHEAYMVKIHGSRQVTQRNRRFLRKVTPFTPTVPVTQEEVSRSMIVTRSQTSSTSITNHQDRCPDSLYVRKETAQSMAQQILQPALGQLPVQEVEKRVRAQVKAAAMKRRRPASDSLATVPPTPAPPTTARTTVRGLSAPQHRREPAGKPGTNMVKMLMDKEREGQVMNKK